MNYMLSMLFLSSCECSKNTLTARVALKPRGDVIVKEKRTFRVGVLDRFRCFFCNHFEDGMRW
jgi:hypothetical protein